MIAKKFEGKLGSFQFFFCSLILSIFLSLILNFIFNIFGIEIAYSFEEQLKSLSFIEKIVIFSIFIPIIETFIFQYGVIKILQKTFLKNHIWAIITISALSFGISHTYHPLYAFTMFLIGIVWACSFIFYQSRKLPAFWIIAIIHGLLNFVAIST
jgi:hypothetical protein